MNREKKSIVAELDNDRESMVEFLRSLLRCRTPNPPGDTRSAISLIERFLQDVGAPYEVVAPNPSMPNIIASFEGALPGPSLILNGHVDVFPVGDEGNWKHDPWGADLTEGLIYGRGACDMKSGTTALLFCFAQMWKRRSTLRGRLTLTVVSDEETFGPWGARYLLENRPEVRGDCLLNAEPTSPFALRFGEKGPLWLKFVVSTPGAHSAYAHMSKSAITIAAEVIQGLQRLKSFKSPAEGPTALALSAHSGAIDNAYGMGASKIISSVTVNVGQIAGGIKVNMIAPTCEFLVDLRIPPEVDGNAVLKEVDSIVAPFPEVSYEIINRDPPNASLVSHPMVQILQDNAEQLGGCRPAPIIGLGGTDARLWRQAGIPAFVYGPSPSRMGASDEYVSIEEFLHTAKTHTLSAYDFLTYAN